MKKSKALCSSVAVLLIAALIAVSFAGCFDSDETAIETTEAETITETTELTEAVIPDSGFTINPESFLTAEKTSAENETAEETDKENVPAGNGESGDYLSTLSANDIKMLNIFLSNFSEAYVENIDTSDMEAMIEFACLNTKINYSEKITYDGVVVDNPLHENWNCTGWVTEEYVAERVYRFFDVEIEHMSTKNYVYQNGRYYFPNADGEAYSGFTKVTSATENSDGTVTVEYDVYWYAEWNAAPSYVYEGIGAQNHDELCQYSHSGTAVVKPVQLGGEGYANYKLVSLERD